MGAGRAGQPGRVAVHRIASAGRARLAPIAAGVTEGVGLAGRRLPQRARSRAAQHRHRRVRLTRNGGAPALAYGSVYFTDRGIEELAERRGEEQVSFAWLADRLQSFV